MIHKVAGHGVGSQEFGDDVFLAHREGSRAVAKPHFVKIGRFGKAFVRCGHQDLLFFAALHRADSLDQGRGAGPQAGREVGGVDIVRQIQGRFQDAGIKPVGKRQGRGPQEHAVDFGLIHACQAVPGGGDSHGQAVFVPVAE